MIGKFPVFISWTIKRRFRFFEGVSNTRVFQTKQAFSALRLKCGVFCVYDGNGNIVCSVDIFGKKEYNYDYEEGRLIRATEANVEFSGEIVTSKVVVNTVKYYYDAESKMTKKVITFSDNSTHTVHYETSDDNTVVKFSADGRTITSHSKTDSFGRKVFDELQLGTDFTLRFPSLPATSFK